MNDLFEGIAKTNTTHTTLKIRMFKREFEGIAKTNTTHTSMKRLRSIRRLRVLLKQILPTLNISFDNHFNV